MYQPRSLYTLIHVNLARQCLRIGRATDGASFSGIVGTAKLRLNNPFRGAVTSGDAEASPILWLDFRSDLVDVDQVAAPASSTS